MPEAGENLWELLYDSLAPLNEPDPGDVLKGSCEAWAAALQPVHDLVRERDDLPSWGILFDAQRCPVEALPYLAQYVGFQIQPEWSEEQIRTEIAEPTGWRRGQIPSIEAAMRRHLTGTQYVVVKPNTPEVGYLYARTLATETPDEALTLADFLTQKPAWMVADYEAFVGFTLADLAAKYETVADAEEAYEVLEDATSDIP